MATTIARLSAVLSTDTGQFQQGFDRAGQTVRRFRQHAEGGGSLGQMLKELAHLEHGADRSSGSLLKLAAFGSNTGLLGLTALFGVLGYKAIEAASKFDESRRKIVDDINAMRREANAGEIDLKFGKSLSEGWAELKNEVTGGKGLGERLRPALQELLEETKANVREFKEFWGIASGPAGKSTLEKLEDLKKKTAEWLVEQKKLREEEAKATEARNREFERMKASAESIAKSFRTPAEIWRDTIAEITKLTQVGLLNLEQSGRAIAKAGEDLDSANKSAQKIRQSSSSASGGTPALSRYSPEAFSAIQAAARQAEAQKEIERQQLQVELQQQKELERVNKQLRDIPMLGIKVGRLT